MFKSAHGVIAALDERLARPRRKSRRKHAARPRPFAGAIESLEDRRLLAVITVTSLLDTVQDRDETLTLREAILIANDSTGATSFEGISSTDVADTIVFDPDVFVSDSAPIFLTQQLPVVTELLTIDGAVDTRRVAIDGLNESRILENASAGLSLRNFILQNGFVFGDGGAILNNRDAVLELNDAEIADSTAAFVVDIFSGFGGNGGGIYNVAGGSVTITDSTLAGNMAEVNGGGLFNEVVGTVTIEASVISENQAEKGGALFNAGRATTIANSVIRGNQAEYGGGIWNDSNAEVSVVATSIAENFSSIHGGGAMNVGGRLTIANSTISDNSAEQNGGGVLTGVAFPGGGGVLGLFNTTVSSNAADRGGGVYSISSTLYFQNTTITANAAVTGGGGIFGDVVAESTIVASNAAPWAADIGGVVSDLGFNLIGDIDGASFATRTTSTLVGVDPQLGPLQDNGGPTFTHALLPGSPAINTGSNPTGAQFDQRGSGFDRTVGPQTDIGAFEDQTPPEPPPPGLIVVGSGLGAAPEIRIFDPETNQLIGSFAPFPSFFRGGIRVATGDVNGDGVPDIVASAAPKRPPRVRVFDGTDLTGGTVLMDFFAYHAGFGGGVFVATGDVNNDGRADIITGAGAGGGPIAKVFSGADLSGGTVLMSFFPYHRGFRGGVQVAAGDINGDGRDDVITGAGPGGGPIAKVFSGADLSGGTVLMSFFPYHRGFRGGVQVAAGDIKCDGRDDVITGAGFGGGPRVKVFSGADLSAGTLLADFFAYGRSFRGGVRVASADVNGDGVDDIITGPGPLGGSHVRAFHGMTGERLETFFAAPRGSTRGVFVAGVSRDAAEPPPSSVPSSGGSGGSSVSFQLIDDLFSDTLVLDELLALNPSLQEHRPTVATL